MSSVKKNLSSIWLRITLLVAAFFFLALLFVSPAVKYTEAASERDANRPSSSPINDLKADDLIKTELQKAIDEIKLRLEQQDSWYHYKFIIIGGLLAIFLGQAGFITGQKSAAPSKYRRLKSALTADSSYAVLALACVVALVIDMHIRNNMFGMQTIGLWVANYAEPVYPSAGYYPWEQFIRNLNSPSIHLDSLYKLAFTLHLHFLTTIIYLLYTIVLQQICLTFNAAEVQGRKQIILFGFVLVHLSTLAFVFVAHAVPSAYTMNLIPFNRWESGWKNVGYYLIPWFLIVVLNVPYLFLITSKKTRQANKSATTTGASETPNNLLSPAP